MKLCSFTFSLLPKFIKLCTQAVHRCTQFFASLIRISELQLCCLLHSLLAMLHFPLETFKLCQGHLQRSSCCLSMACDLM
jgi:hypothetical protein